MKQLRANMGEPDGRIAMMPETKSEPTTAVEVSLPTHLLTQIDSLAAANGKDRSAVIVGLLKKQLPLPSLADVVAPLHENFRQSGMTEQEVDTLIDDEVKAVRAARRARQAAVIATEPPKAVIDAVIYLQAALNPAGPAFAVLELVDAGRIVLVASDETLEEVAEVLSRPKLEAKYPNLSDERRDQLLAVVREVAEVPSAVPRPRALPAPAPDDEPYLNLAVASGAAYLVTWDRDMLELMQDSAFVAQYPNLKILTPVELLTEVTPPITREEEVQREGGP